MVRRKPIVTYEEPDYKTDLLGDWAQKNKVFVSPFINKLVNVGGALSQGEGAKSLITQKNPNQSLSPIGDTLTELATGHKAGAEGNIIYDPKSLAALRSEGGPVLTGDQTEATALAGEQKPAFDPNALAGWVDQPKKQSMFDNGSFTSAMGVIAAQFAQTPGQQQAAKALSEMGAADKTEAGKQKAAAALGIETGGGDIDTIMKGKELQSKEKLIESETQKNIKQVGLMEIEGKKLGMDMSKMEQDIKNNTLLPMIMPDGTEMQVPAKEHWEVSIRAKTLDAQIKRWQSENNLTDAQTAEKLNLVDFNGFKIPAAKASELDAEIRKVGLHTKSAEKIAASNNATSLATANISASASRYHTDAVERASNFAHSPEAKGPVAAKAYREGLIDSNKTLAKDAPMMWIKDNKGATVLNPQYKTVVEDRANMASALLHSPYATDEDKKYTTGLLNQIANGKLLGPASAIIVKNLLTGPPAQGGATTPVPSTPPATVAPPAVVTKPNTVAPITVNPNNPPPLGTDITKGVKGIGKALGITTDQGRKYFEGMNDYWRNQ